MRIGTYSYLGLSLVVLASFLCLFAFRFTTISPICYTNKTSQFDGNDNHWKLSANASAFHFKRQITFDICKYGSTEGVCYTGYFCKLKGGAPKGICDYDHVCCVFEMSCGGIGREAVTYFQSPNYPDKGMGALACDFDIAVHNTICAIRERIQVNIFLPPCVGWIVPQNPASPRNYIDSFTFRIDFVKADLARRLGGMCDIDQVYILNTVDGPTIGQCGPLTGYSTIVAVNPGQVKPVKIVVVIQNEAYYFWNIKATQVKCTQLQHFKVPRTCGRKDLDTSAEAFVTFEENFPSVLQQFDYIQRRHGNVWWSFPEPVFNVFHFDVMKKHQEGRCFSSYRRHYKTTVDRIVGGTDADKNEFPWQIAIFLDSIFFCGGVLLNEDVVLTAAHCLLTRDTPINGLLLQIGDYDLSTTSDTKHVARRVKKVVFHSHFHPLLLSNDIAILIMAKAVQISYKIRPVCLPNPEDSYTERKATVVGWGITSFPNGEPSPVLQKLDVETLSNFQCSRIIEEPVGTGMICAAPESRQGTCFGDSGGPLVIQRSDGADTLIGIVSFGVTGCAVIASFPDIYTRVSEYLNWIAAAIPE